MIAGGHGVEADPESVYAHFCLQKLRILPSVFAELPQQEKAFIIASIQVRAEAEEKEAKKMKKKRR